MSKRLKTWDEKYELVDGKFGEGGNGDVSLVKDKSSGEILVLKELRNMSSEKKVRFCEEIDIMSQNYKDIEGILPVYDYSKEEYWYIMPQAELIFKYIQNYKLGFDKRIDLIISYAEILKKLHDNRIFHRDIKPSNLYVYGNKPYFGDFGLADFQDNNNDFTRSDKGLGAVFTISPEMKRDPKHADGGKADVFSFAKTVWMILTLDEKGFDGQYNRQDKKIALSEIKEYKNIHLKELESLLTNATDNNPDIRPDIGHFLDGLIEFKRIKSDYYSSQLSDWKGISEQIFGGHEPSSCAWEDVNAIINILNVIGKTPAYNHMFYSSKGGMDFERAQEAAEEGCIEIYTYGSMKEIVKPKQLLFQGFGESFHWNYFMLELDTLNQIEPLKCDNSEYETLIEDIPGHYVASDYWQYGVYDYDSGKPLPRGWKLVRRFKRGKFLITLKTGWYNNINSTYDGRHAMCTTDVFKKYIQEMIHLERKLIKEGRDVHKALNVIFKDNPFAITRSSEQDNNEYGLERKQDGEYFIKNNYASWTFLEEKINKKESKIRFSFIFDENGGRHSFSSLSKQVMECVLSKDGIFKKDISDEEVFWIYSRDDVHRIEKLLNSFLEEQCITNDYKIPAFRQYFYVKIVQCGKPSHLFTCEELAELLKEADDRINNTVVINENGEVKLVSDDDKYLYPIRNETFLAGNNYVGKYADVVGVAMDLYPDLLANWLHYLKTGRIHYIDTYLYSEKDIDFFTNEIRCFME